MGPSPARARRTAADTVSKTATGSPPLTVTPSIAYPVALTERSWPAAALASSWKDCVTTLYPLFSMTKTIGSFHSDATFSVSWKAPCFVEPSPKNDRTTWPWPRIWAAQAAPAAWGMPWPTMPDVPRNPRSGSARCIDPPSPLHSPPTRP